MEGGG
jgi:hypothetical protein